MILFRWYLNDEYENFVTTNVRTAAESIPTKPRAKCRILWGSIVVREKLDNMKEASLLKRNSTNANVLKIKKVQRDQIKTYHKEQHQYKQGWINKCRNSIDDRQSWLA